MDLYFVCVILCLIAPSSSEIMENISSISLAFLSGGKQEHGVPMSMTGNENRTSSVNMTTNENVIVSASASGYTPTKIEKFAVSQSKEMNTFTIAPASDSTGSGPSLFMHTNLVDSGLDQQSVTVSRVFSGSDYIGSYNPAEYKTTGVTTSCRAETVQVHGDLFTGIVKPNSATSISSIARAEKVPTAVSTIPHIYNHVTMSPEKFSLTESMGTYTYPVVSSTIPFSTFSSDVIASSFTEAMVGASLTIRQNRTMTTNIQVSIPMDNTTTPMANYLSGEPQKQQNSASQTHSAHHLQASFSSFASVSSQLATVTMVSTAAGDDLSTSASTFVSDLDSASSSSVANVSPQEAITTDNTINKETEKTLPTKVVKSDQVTTPTPTPFETTPVDGKVDSGKEPEKGRNVTPEPDAKTRTESTLITIATVARQPTTLTTTTATTTTTHRLITTLGVNLPLRTTPFVPSTGKPKYVTKSALRKVTIKPKPSTLITSTSKLLQVTTPIAKDALPPIYISLVLKMTWTEFCFQREEFQSLMSKAIELTIDRSIKGMQVVILNMYICKQMNIIFKRSAVIDVEFYLTNERGEFSFYLTEKCYGLLESGFQVTGGSTSFKDRFLSYTLKGEKSSSVASSFQQTPNMATGVIVAIVIASVAGVCFVLLIILQVVLRRRRGKTMRSYYSKAQRYSYDSHSFDSISMTQMSKFRRSKRLSSRGNGRSAEYSGSSARQSGRSGNSAMGYINQALLTEKECPSHPVNFANLASLVNEPDCLEAEFELLPNIMAKLSEVPVGAEDKNRYANVIPNRDTRVPLAPIPGVPTSDYINANYMRGYMGERNCYIATQAPLEQTVADFWRMVWEQQSKLIIMLTDFEEQEVPKCFPYWPNTDGVDTMRLYGDYEVMLKKKEIFQEYTISVLSLKDVERNLCREVIHMWYTAWPIHGTPESTLSVQTFILEARKHMEESRGPAIVHCSPGTGRTGTFLAIDICMQAYEDCHSVDILNCVYRLRCDRGGSVQTKEQYVFIYKALHDYAVFLSNPSSSSSSSSSLHVLT
ncbi:uncharacterized protein LOC106176231 isoform X2 [Lingula anatina]|uniref:Uncharacterized protein LOC106176231 isoform X1 n=1 Tax=Lingula anatina TaxID=7574 RepID=A0A1S3JV55_LINAN|nr:uncharacterized protein LOC106176231 isoform X1 [Lingula anatina]XP_013413979.1 uncharacterized protein LOC106176231 isoform X1 [Lingula anatina]XP_013413980.1 uncharacterized protein LOC106176231 isoform X2 [Lingula anatina]|eukprot:XP_013413978.1 uncharacterized protein LOC106176231 isoform X1 [Lingula anatina]